MRECAACAIGQAIDTLSEPAPLPVEMSADGKHATIPEGTIELGLECPEGHLFRRKLQYSLVSVTLPSSLKRIGDRAFAGCYQLALTSLPEGLTSIGDEAFYCCHSLALTSLPKGLKTIGNRAFRGCSSLALKALPDGVTSIDSQAFEGCTSLAVTSLPGGLVGVGEGAFRGCTSLATSLSLSSPQRRLLGYDSARWAP